MEILDDLAKAALRQETILTIGIFDGLHRGHQALIRRVVDRARETDCLAAVLTFHPHPAAVLRPDQAPPMLTTPGEKVALFETSGIDLVVLLPFSHELARTSARRFSERLRNSLRMRELWIGSDFVLGHRREGNVSRLRKYGQELGFEVHVIDPVLQAGSDLTVVSSSRIRTLLQAGKIREASELLGRYPSLSGEVVYGAQRGRTLGFPTANLEVRSERAVPANGVYAVFALLGAERHAGVANVGIRPSFDNGQRTVETHILGFDRDIYGCDLVIEFVARLRDERRFEDIGDLVTQIQADCREARRILAGAWQSSAWEAPDRRSRSAPVEAAANEDSDINRATDKGAEEFRPGACRHRVEEVEHTADRAIKVWGGSLPAVFVGAARGMYGLMADSEGLVATNWREIHLEGLDRESLLVEWLNELLFITEMEALLLVEAQIVTLSNEALIARVGMVQGEVTMAQIKAATFHNLTIREDETGWTTVITFDV